ncbi:MAG: leucyl aminopeptidase [Candidatus Gastranaerophilales bacterium]|nr:leucyl aminopeptidase [Candidatus Gastranaerophilales bacterium]
METTVKTPLETKSNLFVLGFFENNETTEVQKELNLKYPFLEKLNGNFEGKFNETLAFPLENGVMAVIIGLGKKEEFNSDKLRQSIASGVNAANKYIKNGTISIELPENSCVKSVILGAYMANYRFDKYKTEKENKIETLEILTKETGLEEKIKEASIIGNAMNYTKDMVFESAEIMTPSKAAEIAYELSKKYGLEIKVLDKEELKKQNFNAFLAVGQGSVEPPKFIHLTYKSKNPKKKAALIGKGITFDSGGLDIKPASSMLTMKTDMTGCATVLGVLKAICELKPEIELHVLSALCENMPSGSSYKVGDVIVSKSGKTIEVDNTDAEGRLTLADALTYADELNVDEVIDIATLTGAVITALGSNITGIMGNNQAQIDEFKETALKSGELVWQLPIFDDMIDNLKSDIADMKNTGSKGAGSSVAGRFLQNYTKSEKWLHIDIAGTAYTDKSYKEIQKGATGVMVRSLINYLNKN